MEWLAGNGYYTISISELIAYGQGRREISPKAVILTFDDGFRSVFTLARPILERLNFRATVFVTINHCGAFNDWSTQPPGIPRLPMLSWDELRTLSRERWEIGAHTLTHPPLTRLPLSQAESEVVSSQQRLESELGQPVNCFAYPYGLCDVRIRSIVARHYLGACGIHLGLAGRQSDPYAFERIDAYYLRSRFMTRHLGSAGMDPYLRARQWLRDLRGTAHYYNP